MDPALRLDRLAGLPDDLEHLQPTELRRAFPNPALIELEGRNGAPLFLSVMLHGNETTGFFVLQRLARRFRESPPARPMLIFVGNVHAAEMGVRTLPGGADFNRVWAGPTGPETDGAARIAHEVKTIAKQAGLFASIDIHNNSGSNPAYGCVNALRADSLQLASLFSRLCVYYTNPATTQSIAFTEFCPAVTIECGKPGENAAVDEATQFVLDVLHLNHLDPASHAGRDLQLYHTVGRIIVDGATPFVFGDGDAELAIRPDLERLNFSPLPSGERIARTNTGANPLKVVDERGRDLTAVFLSLENGDIRLARSATPSMFTSAPAIIRGDCLGYLMEELPAAARN